MPKCREQGSRQVSGERLRDALNIEPKWRPLAAEIKRKLIVAGHSLFEGRATVKLTWADTEQDLPLLHECEVSWRWMRKALDLPRGTEIESILASPRNDRFSVVYWKA